MAKCPNCAREVITPFFMNVDAWRWLACPHCAVRLEKRNPRYLAVVGPLLVALISLGGLGHRYRVIADLLMVAMILVILVALALEWMRPQLQLRKAPPKPEIELKINDPSN